MIDAAQVLVPALIAGAVAIGATVAIERWGGRVGGLIGTLPTTIVPAAVGIAATSTSTAAFQDAMFATPVGMFVNASFLLCWRVLPPRLPVGGLYRRLALMTVVSLCLWAVFAALGVFGLKQATGQGIPSMWIGWAFTIAMVVLGVLACRGGASSPKGARDVSLLVLLSRGVLAAAAIGLAIALAGAGGTFLAGMIAVFPAIFLTTMVSLWLSQGEAVPSGAVGPMMLGSVSVAVFADFAAYTLPEFGAGWGLCLAWVLSVLMVTIPAWWWLGRRVS